MACEVNERETYLIMGGGGRGEEEEGRRMEGKESGGGCEVGRGRGRVRALEGR